jgi:hypothetical protein
LKIIVTTSNNYSHLVSIFAHLFNYYWSEKQEVEVVGYDAPKRQLPSNFSFVSLGQQVGGTENFTRDLRGYFAKQDDFFIWSFEDGWLSGFVDLKALDFLKSLTKRDKIGRINLGNDILGWPYKPERYKVYGVIDSYTVYENQQDASYRLSTQISIWNKNFLLPYMQKDLSPWDFELQNPKNDGWHILGMGDDAPVKHNEGVCKAGPGKLADRVTDVFKYNFKDIPQEKIEEMKRLEII